MGHHIDRVNSPCNTEGGIDREQQALDQEDAEVRLGRLVNAQAAEDAARQTVADLRRQLRRATAEMERARQRRVVAVAAELRRRRKGK